MTTFNELKEAIELEKSRFYSLKTKKAKEKSRQRIRDLRTKALLEHLYPARDAYATHSVRGTVIDSTGRGDEIAMKTEEYGLLWISPCNDILSKSWYPNTCCVEYSRGQSVVIECDIDVDSDRLCLIVVPKRIYGGTLNEERYNELCKQDNLAFFKYPDGHMSGLFANK